MGCFALGFWRCARSLRQAAARSMSVVGVAALGLAVLSGTAAADSTPAPCIDGATTPPPPAIGSTFTNPVSGETTQVSGYVCDPVGTPTAGQVAFYQTTDTTGSTSGTSYTFLQKTAGQTFYNDDVPPVPYTVQSISGNTATVTSTAMNTGTTASFPVGQLTSSYDADFADTGSDGTVTPPVDEGGASGLKQVVTGKGGSNGRDGALFVPPTSGGNGDPGPLQDVTLSYTITATNQNGWEVGSVGGNGGSGGNSYLSYYDGKDGGNGGAGGTVIATQDANTSISTSGDGYYGIFAYSRSGEAGNGGSGYAAPGGGTGGHSADGGSVTVNQNGSVYTTGTGSYGVYALSVSNNGGNGGSQWGLVGESGSGGYGGSGGTVIVNTGSDATILTTGDYGTGLLAQSMGGSGGSAGSSGNVLISLIGASDNGGDGGAVTVNHAGAIETQGASAAGIAAQSIGGAGGSGGSAAGLLAVGGVGSNGGNGGTVDVTIQGSGTVLTTGSGSTGVIAQSIGGSGGSGSSAAGLESIGGDGSKGGSGAAVTVKNFGSIETQDDTAEGIIAQSIGGAGGNGGGPARLPRVLRLLWSWL